ncbi:MAG: nucleotidyltransferase family protein [Planctomycetota bacterium]|jgi:dTDP-glucose pyrophosphorylase/CBS domain-containing protein
MKNFKDVLLQPGATMRDAIEAIDCGAAGIALVVDEECRLIATITDGDIRRAILNGVSQEASALDTVKFHSEQYKKPVTAPTEIDAAEVRRLMLSKSVHHLPLVDDDDRVVDIILLSDIVERSEPPLSAVVMAGGYGERLVPLTENMPKPMLEVGGRPLIEQTVKQLRDAGVKHIRIATHYKSEKIIEHFKDGSSMDVKVDYLVEGTPLGTAGALGLIERPTDPLLVINGDIRTEMNFKAMYDFHCENDADLTVGVGKYEFDVPFGVVETKGARVFKLKEKPQYDFFVNAGVYLLEPVAWDFLPDGTRLDMTELIDRMLKAGRSIISFPIWEYWIDIGKIADYRQAQKDFENGRD